MYIQSTIQPSAQFMKAFINFLEGNISNITHVQTIENTFPEFATVHIFSGLDTGRDNVQTTLRVSTYNNAEYFVDMLICGVMRDIGSFDLN